MTQSKNNDTFTVTLDDYVSGEDITINLNDTDGITTSYWAGDSVSDITFDTSTYDGTFTIDTNTVDTVNIDWIYNNMNIDPSRVEKMCQTYPALEKVWRNFKSVYDMVDQDYRGNHEDDDEIPF